MYEHLLQRMHYEDLIREADEARLAARAHRARRKGGRTPVRWLRRPGRGGR